MHYTPHTNSKRMRVIIVAKCSKVPSGSFSVYQFGLLIHPPLWCRCASAMNITYLSLDTFWHSLSPPTYHFYISVTGMEEQFDEKVIVINNSQKINGFEILIFLRDGKVHAWNIACRAYECSSTDFYIIKRWGASAQLAYSNGNNTAKTIIIARICKQQRKVHVQWHFVSALKFKSLCCCQYSRRMLAFSQSNFRHHEQYKYRQIDCYSMIPIQFLLLSCFGTFWFPLCSAFNNLAYAAPFANASM